ncbi:MAG: SDR family oxidoreductase, partial [Ferruginibacter sp.]
AIRVDHPYQSGFAEIMEEVWDRYRLPIAVTEVHLHCSREEQLKWFKEIYDQSKKLLDKNLKIIGVTTWSLLGAFGWSKLLTQPDGEYERGAFDVSSGSLRPTAMAGMIRQLIEKGEFHSPYILQPGWWHLPNRFYKKQKRQALSATTSEQPILIIGNTGTLGKSFAKVCGERSLHYVLAGREEADITRPAAIESAIKKHKPWAIINAAGFVRVDEAERNIETCFLENTVGPGLLAEACYRHHLKLVSFSSDLVFDGEKDGPYVESDITNPLNNYGISKQQAEEKVLAFLPSALMIRTSAFFSPWDKYNFIYDVLLNLNKGHNFEAAADNFVSPTYVPHLVNTTLDLLIDNERGIWHLTNHEKVSWYQFARRAAILFDKDPALIRPVYNLQRPAAMPQQSVLHSEKGNLMPTLSEALLDYFTELTVAI